MKVWLELAFIFININDKNHIFLNILDNMSHSGNKLVRIILSKNNLVDK